eukprot:Hpha_TRINITY_DN14699_c0_g1::TRINITY_DN14699_c0_g1_i1::g.47595::m.47595/K12196/VPS4; vacuolar protein-sorting-associated protein 4
MNAFADKAIKHAEAGNKAFEARNWQGALMEYITAAEHFKKAQQHNKVPQYKELLGAKAEEMVELAERAQKYMKEPPSEQKPPTSPPSPSSKAGSSKPAAGSTKPEDSKKSSGGDGKKDEEADKMRSAIESAIVATKPNVPWSKVAGLERAKEALQEAVVLPMKFPQLFSGKRKPWKGILMYGPPGTGKSYIASAVATECDSTFFSISSADIMSKWVGESEKLVRSLFQLARDQRPSVIFIDEVDSLCSSRGQGDNDSSSRVKTEFLVQMQGVGGDDRGVLVLAATNLPQALDSAIRRRFEYRIEIPLPDKPARAAMFTIHMGKTPNTLTQEDIDTLADQSEGYSGSDISVLVRSALYEPLRRSQNATHFKLVIDPDDHSKQRLQPCSPSDPDPTKKAMSLLDIPAEQASLVVPDMVSREDFEKALKSARPSVSKSDLKEIQQFTEEYGVSAQDRVDKDRVVSVPGIGTQTLIQGVYTPLG